MTAIFPATKNWSPTLDTLSRYAKAIGVVPRALATPHPKWWHISLKMHDDGAATDPIAMPGSANATMQLLMNLREHTLDIAISSGQQLNLPMREGLTGTEFGDQLISALAAIGIHADFERRVFEDEGPRLYDPHAAGLYRVALLGTAEVLENLRSSFEGETGPVQLWPHNFDLAFEWFGTRMVPSGSGKDASELPAQINFGLAPGDSSYPETYFYSNPWPFLESLADVELPSGARWYTDGWKGTLLPYGSIAGADDGAERLAAYFRSVFDMASPLLTA